MRPAFAELDRACGLESFEENAEDAEETREADAGERATAVDPVEALRAE